MLTEGLGAIPLLVVAPPASPRDTQAKRPLTPESLGGSVFTNACSRAALDRSQIRILQPPTHAADSDLWHLILRYLSTSSTSQTPTTILALGDQAIRVLTGHTGRKQAATNLRGYILDPLEGIGSLPILASLDPAFIIERGAPALRRALAQDIAKAVRLAKARGQFTRPDTSQYRIFPPLEELSAYYSYLKTHPEAPIYYDIETIESIFEEEQDLRAGSRGEIYKISSQENSADSDETLSPGELPWDDADTEESPSSTLSTSLLAERALITQIQFATDLPDQAITFTWCSEVAYWTRLIFALPNLRVNVNCVPTDGYVWQADRITKFTSIGIGTALYEEHVQFRSPSKVQATKKLSLTTGLKFEATSKHKLTVVQFSKDSYIRPSTAKKVVRRVEELDLERYNYLIRQPLGKGGIGSNMCDDLDLWRVFGLLYTDGSWSPTHKVFHFSNCDTAVANFVMATLTRHNIKFTTQTRKLSSKKSTWRDSIVINIWPKGLEWMRELAWPQWESSFKKHIQLEAMSQLSQLQLLHFIAGCIDGDGTLTSREIRVCAYNSDTRDMAELYQWAGLLVTQRSNLLTILHQSVNVELLKKISLLITYKQEHLAKFLSLPCRHLTSPSKRIRILNIEGEFWIALKSISDGRVTECADLCTTSQHFTYNGAWIHNCRNFDDPILRASDVPLSDRYLDLMNLYHRVDPDLPMGLQAIASYFWHTAYPWKHLSKSDPGIYGCNDVIALQKIHPPLLVKADQLGVGVSFRTQDMQLAPALDRVQDRGYPCDLERKSFFGEKLDKHANILLLQMRKHYPLHLLPYDPHLYETKPTNLRQGFTEDDLQEVQVEVDELLTYAIPRSLKGKTLPPEVIELAQSNTLLSDVPPHLLKYMKGEKRPTGRRVIATRWQYRHRFNPGSRDHILAYLRWKIDQERQSFIDKDTGFIPSLGREPRGYISNKVWEIPKNPQDPTKDWVGAKGLERLIRRLQTRKIYDPILFRAVKRSKLTKMKSAFVNGWKPSPENLVHTTFKFNPATGQLAAVRPNILQSPKHGALAKQWQRVIRAHPSRRWVTFDFSGFHAITTGFEANDPSYIRAARIDIHGILGYIKERLPEWERLLTGLQDASLMSDQEIAERVKKWARANAPFQNGITFKERRDQVYKRTVLGVQFGMKSRKMYNLAPEAFLSEAVAREVLQTEQSIWPLIFAYQDSQRAKAASPPYRLLSRYGYIRHFTDVIARRYDEKRQEWITVPGKDSEKAVAFEPANDAFGHVRDTIIWLDTQRCPTTGLTWADKFGLVNNVHDSLEFHCPSPYVEECLAVVAPLMQRRNQILRGPAAPDGLWCAVEAHVGLENEGMDTMDEVKVIAGPIDMPIEHVIGWPSSFLESR